MSDQQLTVFATLKARNGVTEICAARGSVLSFEGDAIVNAANEGCVAGFGLDEAVNRVRL